jgi:hypothetical protein
VHEATLVWADQAFERLKGDWANPYFLPDTGYAIPYCAAPDTVSAERSLFPYRAYLAERLT